LRARAGCRVGDSCNQIVLVLRRRPRTRRRVLSLTSQRPRNQFLPRQVRTSEHSEWLSILRTGVQLDFCPEGTTALSPGVLTPGTDIKDVRPESGGREVSALDAERDPQPIFCRPFKAGPYCQCVLGLKPQAQSYSPFGTKNSNNLNICPHFRSHINFRRRVRGQENPRENR
jgi:hypothetical protein